MGSHNGDISSVVVKQWVYVSHVRAHTHDVRALAVAVPIAHEGPLFSCGLLTENDVEIFVLFKFWI